MHSRLHSGLLVAGLLLLLAVLVVGIRFAVLRARPSTSPASAVQRGHARTLRTGEVIWVLRQEVYTPSEGGLGPALVIEYLTHLDESDQAAWAREVQRVWPEFVSDAERAGVSRMQVWVCKPEAALGNYGRVGLEAHFSVVKDASGRWSCAACEALMGTVVPTRGR
jgi:hypothetical protein